MNGGPVVTLQGLSFELLWHAIFGEPYVSMAVSKCDMYMCRLPPPPLPHRASANTPMTSSRAGMPEA